MHHPMSCTLSLSLLVASTSENHRRRHNERLLWPTPLPGLRCERWWDRSNLVLKVGAVFLQENHRKPRLFICFFFLIHGMTVELVALKRAFLIYALWLYGNVFTKKLGTDGGPVAEKFSHSPLRSTQRGFDFPWTARAQDWAILMAWGYHKMSQNEGHFAVNSVNSLTLVGKQWEFSCSVWDVWIYFSVVCRGWCCY